MMSTTSVAASISSGDPRFDRLRLTSTFRGSPSYLAAWRGAVLAVIGAGLLGYRFALEAVLSGAAVRVWDFGLGKPATGGTQFARPGIPKVDSLVAACAAIAPGRAAGFPCDIRHAGVGELSGMSLLVDCSDDPALVPPLTDLSHGLGVPLLRLAVDGSGELELGRVSCAAGGDCSCPMCNYTFTDLFTPTARTPCPGQAVPNRPATLAGGALAAVVAGYGLLQAQRLVTGVDRELVVDREILIDLSHSQLLSLQRRRSDECLSGHVRWRLVPVRGSTDTTTFSDVTAEARRRLDTVQVTLEPYNHPLCIEAVCDCGARHDAVGTRWAAPPECAKCAAPMHWFDPTRRGRLTCEEIEELEIADVPLSSLGLPATGAMFVARTAGKPPLRLVLDERAGDPSLVKRQ